MVSSGKGGVDADEIVGLRPRLQPLDLRGQRLGIGLGPADLLGDGLGVVGEVDARIVRRVRLRHLLGAVAERHDARRRAGDERLGDREERLAEAMRGDRFGKVVVELDGDVAGQLEMLLLVLADRHMGGEIGEDVGGHQVRIGEQADGGVLAVLAGLLLELGHAVQPAHAGDAVEHPGELGMGGDLALVEDDMRLGVDAGGDEGRRHLAGRGGELLRILPDRDRMHVDDAIDAVVGRLQLDEALDGAEIVAEMQVAGGLDARKDPGCEVGHVILFARRGGFMTEATKPRKGQVRRRRNPRTSSRTSTAPVIWLKTTKSTAPSPTRTRRAVPWTKTLGFSVHGRRPRAAA